MYLCHACRKEVVFKARVGRGDTCPHCEAELRCCLNCSFYDLHYANACREPHADLVEEKDRANYCEYFSFNPEVKKQERARQSARTELEALFKKKK
jgi:hypothetical protein